MSRHRQSQCTAGSDKSQGSDVDCHSVGVDCKRFLIVVSFHMVNVTLSHYDDNRRIGRSVLASLLNKWSGRYFYQKENSGEK